MKPQLPWIFVGVCCETRRELLAVCRVNDVVSTQPPAATWGSVAVTQFLQKELDDGGAAPLCCGNVDVFKVLLTAQGWTDVKNFEGG
eukprot:s1291_g16.t1